MPILTRTAVAKSNILVNAPTQAEYFYQDLDASGDRLNGANRYTMTFAKDQTPPVNGFWSLTPCAVRNGKSMPTAEAAASVVPPKRNGFEAPLHLLDHLVDERAGVEHRKSLTSIAPPRRFTRRFIASRELFTQPGPAAADSCIAALRPLSEVNRSRLPDW
jgi:Protein of unknown function (DUF1214)